MKKLLITFGLLTWFLLPSVSHAQLSALDNVGGAQINAQLATSGDERVPVAFPTLKHKVFYKNGYWLLGRAVSFAAVVVDVVSTERAIKACPVCGDSFMFFNVNSDGRAVDAGLVGFGISTLLSIGEYHFSQEITAGHRVSGWHLLGYLAQPVTDGVVHGYGAASNFQLVSDCRTARLSCK